MKKRDMQRMAQHDKMPSHRRVTRRTLLAASTGAAVGAWMGWRPSAHVRAADVPVKNPDTFVLLNIGDVTTLDPDCAYDTYSDMVVRPTVYETLISYAGASINQYAPQLASQVPSASNGLISPDGLTYAFPIRQGVRFHDGSTMTPDDVVYSLRRFILQDQAGGPAWLLMSPLLGVDSTRDKSGKIQVGFNEVAAAVHADGDRVVLHLKQPFAPFLSIAAAWGGVMSRKWATSNGDWDGNATTWEKYNNPKTSDRYQFDHMNGTGPFMLQRWDRQNSEVLLTRNDNYWRKPPRLQRIVIRAVTELATRRLQLSQGDADFIIVSPSELSQLRDIGGTVIEDNLPQMAVQTVMFNYQIDVQANPDVGSGKLDGAGIPADFFADLHVRRGFAYAFDYAANLAGAYSAHGILPHGPIIQGLLGYDPTIPVYTTNRGTAIAEFKEAMGGKVWDTGFNFTIPYTAGNAARLVGCEIIRDSMAALNPKFQVSFRPVPASTLADILLNHRGTMIFTGWFADYPDPHDFAQPFLASNGYYPTRGGYRNAQADQLIQQAVNTTDPARRTALYRQLSMISYNDVPYLFLVQPTTFYTMRSWLHGWYYNPVIPQSCFYTLYK